MKGPALALTLTCLATAAWSAAPGTLRDDELTEVVVTGLEPVYVAPTTRDRIGRVWVPVKMGGKGPFRLVFDTGAQHSALTPATAAQLGIPLDRSPPVLVHGVTGSAVSPTVLVDSLHVGDLQLQPSIIPVVADVFGGAEGLLGTEGMHDLRIFIDFRHDLISMARSRNQRPARGFGALRILSDPLNLLVVSARIGHIDVRAIIDTGAQGTVGNTALREALRRQDRRTQQESTDRVRGATGDWQSGIGTNLSPIQLGDLLVHNAHVTFADLHIFQHWKLEDQPALVIGMDIIGLVDQLVIDYRRQELQIKPRGTG